MNKKLAKKWADYQIDVMNGIKGIFIQFQSIDEKNNKINKPLRISKNGKVIGFVKKISEENKKEKVQIVPKKYDPIGMANQDNNIDLEDNNE